MLQQGLHRSTVADVAEAAGLGKGTVYLHFDSKQDLADGLRRRYVEQIESEVRTKVGAAASAPEKLRAAVRSFAVASIRRHDLHHLLFQEAGVDEAQAFAPIRAVFAEVINADDFDLPNRELAIDYVLGGVHAALIAIAHSPAARRGRATSQIADLVVRTLT